MLLGRQKRTIQLNIISWDLQTTSTFIKAYDNQFQLNIYTYIHTEFERLIIPINKKEVTQVMSLLRYMPLFRHLKKKKCKKKKKKKKGKKTPQKQQKNNNNNK